MGLVTLARLPPVRQKVPRGFVTGRGHAGRVGAGEGVRAACTRRDVRPPGETAGCRRLCGRTRVVAHGRQSPLAPSVVRVVMPDHGRVLSTLRCAGFTPRGRAFCGERIAERITSRGRVRQSLRSPASRSRRSLQIRFHGSALSPLICQGHPERTLRSCYALCADRANALDNDEHKQSNVRTQARHCERSELWCDDPGIPRGRFADAGLDCPAPHTTRMIHANAKDRVHCAAAGGGG